MADFYFQVDSPMSEFNVPEPQVPESQRLSKRLMELVQCSRREAELYIEGGWVRVDGVMVEQPQLKVTNETIELDPHANITRAGPVTIIAHRMGLPAGEGDIQLAADGRWAEDTYPIHRLACHLRRLQRALPLEEGVQGMEVLTQDPGLLSYLHTAQANIEQEFVVQVVGQLTPEQLALLNHGWRFEGKSLRPASVSWQNETHLRFALKNPLPRQIVFMCEQVNLRVQQIKRIRIGAVPLRKMPLDQWRYFPAMGRF
jgi:23S rRNA pseudouridine2604 synthase